MTKPKNDDKLLKHQKLRYAEYYGMTEIFDDLYSKSQKGFSFKNLMNIIISPENILLAYRTIKRNGGSQTEGVDGVTIKDLENLTQEDFISKVQRRFQYYRPRKVRRVEIPKPNGKKRPLGIPRCGTEWPNSVFYKCWIQSVKRNFTNTVMDLDP